tara:strand:- start:835 stop:1068 length:234 start_codon:yes stop_codon:yes gene_type:complete
MEIEIKNFQPKIYIFSERITIFEVVFEMEDFKIPNNEHLLVAGHTIQKGKTLTESNNNTNTVVVLLHLFGFTEKPKP